MNNLNKIKKISFKRQISWKYFKKCAWLQLKYIVYVTICGFLITRIVLLPKYCSSAHYLVPKIAYRKTVYRYASKLVVFQLTSYKCNLFWTLFLCFAERTLIIIKEQRINEKNIFKFWQSIIEVHYLLREVYINERLSRAKVFELVVEPGSRVVLCLGTW